jgi:hypothetical protein
MMPALETVLPRARLARRAPVVLTLEDPKQDHGEAYVVRPDWTQRPLRVAENRPQPRRIVRMSVRGIPGWSRLAAGSR